MIDLDALEESIDVTGDEGEYVSNGWMADECRALIAELRAARKVVEVTERSADDIEAYFEGGIGRNRLTETVDRLRSALFNYEASRK